MTYIIYKKKTQTDTHANLETSQRQYLCWSKSVDELDAFCTELPAGPTEYGFGLAWHTFQATLLTCYPEKICQDFG